MKQKIVVNKGFEDIKGYVELLHEEPADRRNIIYAARNIIYTESIKGLDLTIKSFRRPSLFNRLIYTFIRTSKAQRSYENAVKLTEKGIGTPQPIAYKLVYDGGLINRSYFVYKYLANCQDLRWWERKPNRDEVLEHLAEFIGFLHKNGIWHKDLSPGNVLYDDNWNFYVIDINRMEFDVHDPEKLMQNFKCLHDEPEETERLAKMYVKYSPFQSMGEVDIVDMALGARAKYKEKQARKRAFKSIFK